MKCPNYINIDGSEHIALFQFNGKVRSAAARESDAAEADAVVEVANRVFLPQINR